MPARAALTDFAVYTNRSDGIAVGQMVARQRETVGRTMRVAAPLGAAEGI
jgi:hypothetical protein